MSRAFVREEDADAKPAAPPEIAIPAGPNPVTARGLRLIETAIAEIEAGLRDAAAADVAPLRRRVRYWTARRATARLTAPPEDSDSVGFGSRISVDWPGRGLVHMEIVGDDEADPAAGRVSWRAPTAAALIGSHRGDRVEAEVGGREVTLTVAAVDNDLGVAGSG